MHEFNPYQTKYVVHSESCTAHPAKTNNKEQLFSSKWFNKSKHVRLTVEDHVTHMLQHRVFNLHNRQNYIARQWRSWDHAKKGEFAMAQRHSKGTQLWNHMTSIPKVGDPWAAPPSCRISWRAWLCTSFAIILLRLTTKTTATLFC